MQTVDVEPAVGDIAGTRRSDARRSETALIRAATAAIHREGLRVPLATIADEAGVGIATLYRHFPSRDHLLSELTHRSFEQVLDNARSAVSTTTTPIEALRLFIEAAIAQRNQLVLPLHGGPPITSPATIAVQSQVHQIIRQLLERGSADGSIKDDVTPREIIAFGALLAQPHTAGREWDDLCRRLLGTFLHGLAPRRC